MKTLLFTLMLFTLSDGLFAQAKPIKKTTSTVVKKKTSLAIRPTAIPAKTKKISPSDTATVPEANVNPSKMQLPKTVGPSATKLNNSVMKTPVYNNAATGTNGPGDVNTGLRPDNTLDHPQVNNNLNQVRVSADSANKPH